MSIWKGRAMKNIVIFSGTTEGRTLSELLCENGIPHLISVATEYGKQLCPEHMLARVVQGRMNTEEMAAFLTREQIDLVIDATHPYAVEVTENIRQAVLERSKQGQAVKYLRYVRETYVDETASVCSDKPVDDNSYEDKRMIHYYGSAEECEQALHSAAGNILLTTGSKELPVFCQSEELTRRLIVRVLPGQESIALCEEQGLLGRQIIAMQGPFSEDMNLALIRQYQISHMVTKQSGKNGGFPEKVAAARKAGIPLYVIGTPSQETGNSLEEILQEIGIVGADLKSMESVLQGYGHAKEAEPVMDIHMVGCGMGSQDMLTVAAARRIEHADVLLGASRLIEPYTAAYEKKAYYQAKDIVPYLTELTKRFREGRIQQGTIQVVILFSGDTGFYSGCEQLYSALQEAIESEILPAKLTVLPGISSVSYLASCLHTGWGRAAIMSVHGKGDISAWREELLHTVRKHEKTFLLVSRAEDVIRIAELLQKLDNRDCANACYQLYAGYQLSYPEERIYYYDSSSEVSDLQNLPDGLYTCLILRQNC